MIVVNKWLGLCWEGRQELYLPADITSFVTASPKGEGLIPSCLVLNLSLLNFSKESQGSFSLREKDMKRVLFQKANLKHNFGHLFSPEDFIENYLGTRIDVASDDNCDFTAISTWAANSDISIHQWEAQLIFYVKVWVTPQRWLDISPSAMRWSSRGT